MTEITREQLEDIMNNKPYGSRLAIQKAKGRSYNCLTYFELIKKERFQAEDIVFAKSTEVARLECYEQYTNANKMFSDLEARFPDHVVRCSRSVKAIRG